MKRSDLVSILAKDLYLSDYYMSTTDKETPPKTSWDHLSDGPMIYWLTIADAAISSVEEMGMAPPFQLKNSHYQ